MRSSFDFSPFYRSSIGFDRVFEMLEDAARVESIDNWPAYDIFKTSEDGYRVQIAVAGFGQDELNISSQPNLLVVSGEKKPVDGSEYLHRGIAQRAFTRRFELADHVKVTGANLVNGLLAIDLQREIPESMKPRRIAISTFPAVGTRQIIESKKAA
jgi:molecular chaperone IbpA